MACNQSEGISVSKIAILDPAEHRDLRIKQGHGAQFGENVPLVPLTANELRQAVVEFPVFLVKDPGTGQFGLCALLGRSAGHNAFLRGDRWRTRYVPLHIRRQPFLVAERAEGEGAVAIDLDSSRVSQNEGERLFDDAGEGTAALACAKDLLVAIMQAARPTAAFITALVEARLIRPAELAGACSDDLVLDVAGLYEVDRTALASLRGERLEQLHGAGHLFGAHLLIASCGNLSRLSSDYQAD
jgi:hypothetical protein